MTARSWTDIQSIVIDGKLALTKLVQAGRQSATFATSDPDSNGQAEYYIQLFRAADRAEAGKLLQRFEEVRFLDHPLLMQALGIGFNEEESLVYYVSHKPAGILSRLYSRSMPVDEAKRLTSDLISAVRYLHSENLVFCNLRPEAIWKTEMGWTLADFGHVRLIGRSDTRELRLALARYGDIPPEAYQGLVSPAWDVWSLGVLLQRVLTEDPGHSGSALPRARQLRAGLPEPFQTIVRDCLDPDPNERPTLDTLERYFANDFSQEAAATGRALDEPNIVRRPSLPVPAFTSPQPPPAWTSFFKSSLLVILLIALLGVAVWTWALTRKGAPAKMAAAPAVSSEADRLNPPGPAPKTQPAAPAAVMVPSSTKAQDGSIPALLNYWVDTTRKRDLNGQMSCYASVVDTFYGQHRVSNRQVYSEKEKQFDQIGVVKKFDIDNLQITNLSRSTAAAIFDKNWAFGNNSGYSGSVRTQLTFRNFQGHWKIVGERELKIYWVRRGGAPAQRHS